MTSAPRGTNALIFIVITVLLDVIGFSLVLPVLPAVIVELTGDTVSQAAIHGGWLAFVYAAMQFFWAPILGNLSDRFGRRPVLLAAIGTLGLDYIITGLAPTLGWLFLGRCIAGISGASFTPAYAYVADVSTPEKRAQNFGMVSAAFGIGFVLGPAIGGALGQFGSRAPFFAAAALSLINFCYGYFVLPESLPADRRRPFEWRRANPLGTLLRIRTHPEVFGLLSATFLWMMAHQVMPSTWSYYGILRFGWSPATVGLSLACVGMVMAISQAGIGRVLIPRMGERRVVLTGMVMAIIGYTGYAFATAGWMMFAWLATWFFGALVMPSTNGLMSRRMASNAQGELQGAVASLFSLSSILGPPLMTRLFSVFSAPTARVHLPGAAFLSAAAMTAVGFLVFYRTTRGWAAAG